ncbi:MAG: response regulator [Patescibacteria group bacterium]
MAQRVLVVDDEGYLRDLYKEVLERDGFTVDTCADGETALPVYQGRGPFHLVLTDVGLGTGKMDGLVLARTILELDPKQPIIIMSAKETIALQQAQQSGIPTLRKPFRIDELSRLAREHARP